MKFVTLPNSHTVIEANIKVVLTHYDLVAAASWAIAHRRQIKNRKQLIRLVCAIVESRGIGWFVRATKRFKPSAQVAAQMVERFFPELIARPSLEPSMN